MTYKHTNRYCINGARVDPINATQIDVINPANEAVFATGLPHSDGHCSAAF